MTEISEATLKILARPGADYVEPSPSIPVDLSSRDELARSISGALADCPHMSQDKIADYVASQLWGHIEQLKRLEKTADDLAWSNAAKLERATREAGVDREDAQRWRALQACPRIRMYGSAGVDPKTGVRTEGTHVHFGADFWSAGVIEPDDGQSGSASTALGRHCLTALADAIRELEANRQQGDVR